MSQMSTIATEVDLLRAIRELADPAAHDAGSEPTLPTLLERLLGCDAVVTMSDDGPLVLPGSWPVGADGKTELVIEGVGGGLVVLRRPPTRPFGERDVLLCDVLRPHVAAWLTHVEDSGEHPGRSAITQRQLEILALIRCGMSNKEVARVLGITGPTVRKHLEGAFARLGVATRTAAVAEVFGAGADAEARHV